LPIYLTQKVDPLKLIRIIFCACSAATFAT